MDVSLSSLEDVKHRLSTEALHSRAIRRGFKVIVNCDDWALNERMNASGRRPAARHC
jgi:hypothetical protein